MHEALRPDMPTEIGRLIDEYRLPLQSRWYVAGAVRRYTAEVLEHSSGARIRLQRDNVLAFTTCGSAPARARNGLSAAAWRYHDESTFSDEKASIICRWGVFISIYRVYDRPLKQEAKKGIDTSSHRR